MENTSFLMILIAIIGFIAASLAFIYAFSFLFSQEENGQKFYILTVMIITFALVYLEITIYSKEYTLDFLNDKFTISVATLFPASNLGLTLYKFWMIEIFNTQDMTKLLLRTLSVSSSKIICINDFLT